MLRPKGKAYRIAQRVIPSLRKILGPTHSNSSMLMKDDVELKITKINENRGRLNEKKRKTGIR